MSKETYNIAFVSSELFPVTRGGAGVQLHHHARTLLARGHNVHILLDGPAALAQNFRVNHQKDFINASALTLWPMEDLPGVEPLGADGPATWYQRKARQWFQAVGALCEKVGLDVIEFPDFYGFGCMAVAAHRWMGFLPRIQIVVRAHCTMEQLQEQEIGCYVDSAALLMHEQERLAMQNADTVISPSAPYSEMIRRKYSLTRPPVLGPPPTETPPSRPRSGSPDAILFVARLFHFKGADIFVDAAVRLLQSGGLMDDRVRFIMAGYDSNMGPGLTPFRRHLEKRIPKNLAGRFQFPDHLSPEELADLFSRAVCYVCPSRIESFAYSVHEAKSAGAPLILADLEAFMEFFTDGANCLKFDGSAGDLADKMGRLVSDVQLQKKLGASAAPAMGEAWKVYEDLAAEARRMPLKRSPAAAPGDIMAVVIKTGGQSDGQFTPAVEAVRQSWPGARIIYLTSAGDSSANTVPLLGRLWETSEDSLTGRLMLLCLDTDRFDVDFLRKSAEAMLLEEQLGFIASCPVDRQAASGHMGRQLDLELSLWPVIQKSALSRSILKTRPGVWLGDLFDRRVEAYGEIDYLWRLQDRGLQGYQWPRPSAVFGETDIALEHPSILESMLLRNGNPRRMAMQSRYLAQMAGKTTEPLAAQPTFYSDLRRLLKKALRSIGR